jgi:hypothetical protein
LTTRFSDHRSTAATDVDSAQLARLLYRPIVFQEPERVVHPPSWLEHIPFAFWIVEALRPDILVELGTHSGNSYASFAQAVQTIGLSTRCYAVDTWQGDAQAGFYQEDVFTEWSAYHERHFAAFSRLIRSTFAEAVVHFSDGSIDLLHLDGFHTYEAVSEDLRQWWPKLSRRAVLLMHDTNVRERDFGAWRVWEELKTRFPHFEFLHGHGLGVLAVGTDIPEPVAWLLSRSSADNPEAHLIRQFFARVGGVISARAAVDGLQQQLVQSRAERDELAAAARNHALDVARLQQAINDGRTQHERVEAELRTENSKRAEVAEAIRRERASLEDDVARLTSEIATLTDRLEVATAAVDRRSQLVAELRARLAPDESPDANADSGSVLSPAVNAVQGAVSRFVPSSRLRRLARIAKTPGALGLLPANGRGPRRSALRCLRHPGHLHEAHVIAVSGLFDERFYEQSNPDILGSRLTPLAHYVLKGAREGRNPHPLFDGAYYLRTNPDVASARVNPLVHYCRTGAKEGRNPHPLFDVHYYLTKNPDVRNAGIEPLGHFLRFGWTDGRNPNQFFDCAYYLQQYPDVAASRANPLIHFATHGWRERRRTSPAFDTAFYVAQNPDLPSDLNPLSHFLEYGTIEGRAAVGDSPGTPTAALPAPPDAPPAPGWSPIRMQARSLAPARMRQQPMVICLSHVMPLPPRAGNEYRIYRLLRWLRDRGYRVIPVIAPLPGVAVQTEAVEALAEEFSNAVVCGRDGRLDYVLRGVPDVLASLGNELTRPVSILLNEDTVREPHARQMLSIDQTFCHDALITTALRLHQALGAQVMLAEYIWMSRVLPLVSGNVIKVLDTHDVYSTKADKVLRHGIDDVHVEAVEETRRLRRADLVIAIQDEERYELQKLAGDKPVVTAGVDFDVVADPGAPSGRSVLYVASDNAANRKGLLDFLRFAWPGIRRNVPDAELLVAGRVGAALDADVPGVRRLGLVADLGPLYAQSRVVINPAVAGTGLKIKTLEALGHLRPVVTWPSGTDGLAPELKALCTEAEDWFAFSRKVAERLAPDNPLLFSATSRDAIVRLMSPPAAYQSMTDAIEAMYEQRFGVELRASLVS